jgi:superfamily II DNA or RNA helicase
MPTGSGKTRIAAIDSKRVDAKRILYIAHTHEILDGAEREFAHVYGANAVHRGSRYAASNPTPSVHLSTIQSVSRSLTKGPLQEYDYVIVDEFHHAAAQSYRRLISQVRPVFLLGLTATPFRGDKQDVIELCRGNVIVNFELLAGINNGVLVPYH